MPQYAGRTVGWFWIACVTVLADAWHVDGTALYVAVEAAGAPTEH